MTTGQSAIQLIRYRPLLFLGTIFFRGLDDLMPFAVGIIMKGFFDTLTGEADAGFSAWTFVAFFVVLELSDRGVVISSAVVWARWRYAISTLLRKNLMTAIMDMSAPHRVSSTSGEVTNRLRDDVEAIIRYLEQYIHLWGNLIFAVLAIIWMVRIDVGVTLITVIPSILIITLVNVLRRFIRRYRTAQRVATEQSTNFINELFQSILAVKVARTESDVISHFRRLNDARRKATLVDNLFNQLLRSISYNISHLATGCNSDSHC